MKSARSLWTFVLMLIVLGPGAAAEGLASAGKAEIISLIQAQRLAANSFSVEYTIGTDPDAPGTMECTTLAISPAAFFLDYRLRYGSAGDRIRHTISSCNTDGCTTYKPEFNAVTLHSGPEEMASVDPSERSWYMHFMRYYPNLDFPADGADLLAVLPRPDVVVATDAELIDGVQCIVFEQFVPDVATGHVIRSWTLDPSRGFLPVVQRRFGKDGVLVMEMRIDAAVEAPVGGHFPVRASYRNSENGQLLGKVHLVVKPGTGLGGYAIWVGLDGDVPRLESVWESVIPSDAEVVQSVGQ